MQPRLSAIATASPAYVLDRAQAEELGRRLFGLDLDRLGSIHANAGIDRRASCVPPDWLTRPHGWAERSRLFVDNAVTLGTRAAAACLDSAGLRPVEVDAIVAVSTTGVATPSLDALLMAPLGLRTDVIRLPVFGLGCAGGVLGLARAA
ncbi:MAG: type III polyketide synthase, partial [Pseudomonadota bacterium]